MIEYTIVRSRRRTVSLQIKPDLAIVVRAPMRMAKRDIERFVQNHEAWIEKNLAQMSRDASNRPPFTFADGDCVPCLGGELTLATGGKGAMEEEGLLLLPEGVDRKEAVTEFLREKARTAVMEYIGRLAGAMDVLPQGVKMTSAATRWGSCSGKNRLCFSWRVAFLPPALIEYIVVHELAHIREHNHSLRFWAIVESWLPDYRERRSSLREFQRSIPF